MQYLTDKTLDMFMSFKTLWNVFYVHRKYVNLSPAELFQIIFHSFKAGIANAISSFK